MTDAALAGQLDEPYNLTDEQIRWFQEDGFIKLKNVFSPQVLDYYGQEITRLTLEHNRLKDQPMEKRSTYDRAFIQVGNLWRLSAIAKAFSFNRRTARIAAQLLGTRGIRMWHDQALYKEAGGGFTPWHADQQYWPMATGKSVTAWIPFQAVPIEMGPLCFGRGSHRKNVGRDIEISDDSERRIRAAVAKHGIVEVQEPFEPGEVSFHFGWTLHRAGPNTTGRPRNVHTIIYMDSDMCLAKPANANQENDRRAWVPTVAIGDVMDSELTPILWEGESQGAVFRSRRF